MLLQSWFCGAPYRLCVAQYGTGNYGGPERSPHFNLRKDRQIDTAPANKIKLKNGPIHVTKYLLDWQQIPLQ